MATKVADAGWWGSVRSGDLYKWKFRLENALFPVPSLADRGVDEEGRECGWSTRKRRGRNGIVDEKRVQGSEGRRRDEEMTEGY